LKASIIIFTAISFLAYGLGCFTSQYFKQEFKRYGFPHQRPLIGLLQLCGALGLIGGFWFPLLGKAGAGGLALMMLCGILVRIKIRDTPLRTMPAILYFLLNTYLALFAY